MASARTDGLTGREMGGGVALAMLAAIGFGGWAFATDRIERLEADLASHHERMGERVDALKEEVADADRRRAGLVTRVDKLKLRNERLDDQLAMAREKLAARDAQPAPSEATASDQAPRKGELEAAREEHQAELAALEATVAEVQQVRNRLAKRRRALERVENTLAERRRELERLTRLVGRIDDPLAGGALWLTPLPESEPGGEAQ